MLRSLALSQPFAQTLERAAEFIERACRPPLPAGIESVEIGPPTVHDRARSPFRWLASHIHHRDGRDRMTRRKAFFRAFNPRPKSREKFDTG